MWRRNATCKASQSLGIVFFERKKISLVIQYFGGYEREFNYLRKLRTKASSTSRKIYYLRSCLIDNTIDSLFFFQQFLLQHERVRTQLMIWAYFLSHSLPLSSHVALWLRVINFVPFIGYFKPNNKSFLWKNDDHVLLFSCLLPSDYTYNLGNRVLIDL